MDDSNLLPTPLPTAYLVPVFVSEAEEAYLLTKIEEVGGTPVNDDDEQGNAEGAAGSSSPRKFKGKPTGWREVKGRRSMYWGGTVMKSNTLIPVPLPSFMQDQFPKIIGRVAETGAFKGSKIGKPNHILVNEYLPGQGIFPHGDGPAYYPTVATLSLGSHTILDVFAYATPSADPTGPDSSTSRPSTDSSSSSRPYDPTPLFSILLPRRSLFILTSSLYQEHLHGIAEREADSMEDLKKCVNWEEVSSRRSRWEMGEEQDGVGEWKRERRVSLTMRAVEKVRKLF